MNIILAIIIILSIFVSDYIFFKKITEHLYREPAPKKEQPKKIEKDETPDNKASNAERLYMEGIQNVLTYNLDTAMKYLKEGEEI